MNQNNKNKKKRGSKNNGESQSSESSSEAEEDHDETPAINKKMTFKHNESNSNVASRRKNSKTKH